MDLFIYFFKRYPTRTIIVFTGATIASVITAITLLALPALLASMLGRNTGKVEAFKEFFMQLGINPTTENLLVFLISGIILQNLLLSASKIYAGFTVAKIVKDLRIQLLTSMSQTEWGYFIKQSSGEFTAALVNEINKAGDGYLTMVEILSISVQICAYLLVAFIISWQIAIIAIITSIVLTIIFGKLISLSKQLGAEDITLIRKITAQLTDSYRSIKSLKAMAREKHSHSILSSYAKELKVVYKKTTMVSELLSMFQEIILMLTIILTVYFAFDRLEIPLEFSIILVILYLRALKSFGKAQKQYQSYVGNIDGYQRVTKSLKEATEHKEKKTGNKQDKLTGNINLVDISFSYENKLILDNASATIYQNKINSIIGSSGAGKTTFVDIICGLYHPSSGQILVNNNTPLSNIDLTYWRKQIGYVTQENNLLNASIRDNITLGDSSFTAEEINSAILKSHSDDFIKELPEKADTIVGENGVNLSGGQRQRILIARALVHQPNLLILDEATSALDSQTEKSLSYIFKELSNELTIISISHRPALVEISDHVIELENGKLNVKM